MAIAGGLAFATAALAEGMTHAQYEAAEKAIKADYKAAKMHCDALSGRAEDVCEAEAKGAARVAKADLRARYEPSAKHSEAARNARVEARYSVAMERCDALSGDAEDACEKQAKAEKGHGLTETAGAVTNSSAEYSNQPGTPYTQQNNQK
jgi:hypothetical protein